MKQRSASRRSVPSSGELAVMESFIRAERAGRNPDIKEYLARHARYARTLRPVLEGMKNLRREQLRFEREYPGFDIELLLDKPRPSR